MRSQRKKTDRLPKAMNNKIINRAVPLGDGLACIVDPEDYEVFTHLRCSYIKTQRCYYGTVDLIINGTIRTKRIHRIIARTGPYQVCHHKNRNSLDNRLTNLANMDPKLHDHLHKSDTLRVKFKENFPIIRKIFNRLSPTALNTGLDPVQVGTWPAHDREITRN